MCISRSLQGLRLLCFNNAIIRICGKRDGSAGYFINRNDQMLQGYVRIVDPVVILLMLLNLLLMQWLCNGC